MKTLPWKAAAALALCVAACSPEPADVPDAAPAFENTGKPPTASLAPQPVQPPAPPPPSPAANVLTLEGLGVLKIGAEVPAGSSWAERGAQIPGQCRTISSPDFPGVYAIVEEGKVRRITIGERSRVKLARGMGTGASEAQVRASFPNLTEEPHKYVGPPGKYLTDPNSDDRAPALRFEIGQDKKVSLIHVGTAPVLGYVEGCA